ncbi:hypothetical protein V6N12_069327 [Hibiscus sabdariffa]|uniref:Uncharacterized protein n=1 Tax=Hibiscus sabdariffa TaxID=183260 RepID=A0ABR2FDX3_9ROSI
MVRDAGYRTIMWFAYVVPCEKLEDGTTIAWDDDSFRNMIEHCKMGALHVYVEHRVDIPKYADYESNDDVLKIYYESRVGTRVNGGPASSVVGEASNVAVGDSKDAFEGESKATFEVKGKGKGKGKGKVAFEEKGKGEASLQGDAKGEASFEKDGNHFLKKLRIIPKLTLLEMKRLVKEYFNVDITIRLCSKARIWAMDEIDGRLHYEFNRLFDYATSLREVDPNCNVDLMVEKPSPNHKKIFRRI